MTTLGNKWPTLMDHARRTDPDGRMAAVAELLHKMSPVLKHIPWVEGNLPVGHQHSVRTGLPTVYTRALNEGVYPSKSTTKQIQESLAMIEGYHDVDVELAELGGNVKQFRLDESKSFMESMAQKFSNLVYYGNELTSPKDFTGLAPKYALRLADGDEDNDLNSGYNVVHGGGSGNDNTSIWLVGWSPDKVFGIYPKGSKAGLQVEDLGKRVVTDSLGRNLTAYSTHFSWKCGLAIKDWRYVGRIANIDISDLRAGNVNAADITNMMIDLVERMPDMANTTPIFYMHKEVRKLFRVQVKDTANVNLTLDSYSGKIMSGFDGIPIERDDSILITESLVPQAS